MGKGRRGTGGVRGPGGPPGRQHRPAAAQPTGSQAAFYRLSAPLLRTLHGLPRWVPAVVPGLLLFGGLVMTGPLAWLGALFLLLVLAYLAWLLALSWPRIGNGSRFGRLIVIAGLLGLTVLKLLGRL